MKILLVLLACIAASNAFCTYSYSYYYRRQFCVQPAPQTFCFNIYFNRAWCSSKFYAPILKYYPGDDCGKDGWQERTIAEVETEMSNLLKESLATIVSEMTTKKNEWIADVEKVIADYKTDFATYINRYYEYYISNARTDEEKAELEAKRDARIAKYNDDLDNSKAEALKNYNTAMEAKIQSITDYHTKLLENAVKCLTTRQEKIKEYTEQLTTKITEYVNKYYKYLLAVLKVREDRYRKTLEVVHGDYAEGFKDKIDAVIQSFHDQECILIKTKSLEYLAKLLITKAKLVSYYTCSYRCYLTNGCLQFYKRSYYNTCRSLGCWWSYTRCSYKMYGCLSGYSYCWRGISYKGLKTCDVGTINKSVEDIKAELEAQLSKAVGEYTTKFNEWKAKWAQYHVDYIKAYKEIIEARHANIIKSKTAYYVCLNNSTELTDEQKAEIAALTQELKEKMETAIAEYTAKLLASLIECFAKFHKSIADYTTKVNEMIKSITDKYTECLATRITKIADYKKKLEDSRDKQRSALLDSLVKSKNAFWKTYVAMYEFHHGETLPDSVNVLGLAYADKLVIYCNSILAEFDAHWTNVLDKLVLHYTCCAKCYVGRFCMPRFCYGSYFSWKFTLPCVNSYSYCYTRYVRTCSYRVRYCSGYYRYCA